MSNIPVGLRSETDSAVRPLEADHGVTVPALGSLLHGSADVQAHQHRRRDPCQLVAIRAAGILVQKDRDSEFADEVLVDLRKALGQDALELRHQDAGRILARDSGQHDVCN